MKILKRLKRNEFDIHNTVVPMNAPTIVHMKKKKGCTDHVVGILGSTLYDSCNDFTLSRTSENLDHACRPCEYLKELDVVQLQDDLDAIEAKRKRNHSRNKRKYEVPKVTTSHKRRL